MSKQNVNMNTRRILKCTRGINRLQVDGPY